MSPVDKLAQTAFELHPTLPMGVSPLVLTAVPEPSVLVLGLLGLIAWDFVVRARFPWSRIRILPCPPIRGIRTIRGQTFQSGLFSPTAASSK